ncbi:hypothetical protein V8G54_024961, partial [Vigna mungo]
IPFYRTKPFEWSSTAVSDLSPLLQDVHYDTKLNMSRNPTSETYPFLSSIRGKVSTRISSLFYRPFRTKRLISSTASHRRRDSLFYPPTRGKVTINSSIPFTVLLGRRDSSLSPLISNEKIHTSILSQEERQQSLLRKYIQQT